MSQRDRILTRLRAAPLTAIEALSELGVGRLGARVMELRQLGHPIETEMMEVTNRFGDKCKVGRYRLIDESSE